MRGKFKIRGRRLMKRQDGKLAMAEYQPPDVTGYNFIVVDTPASPGIRVRTAGGTFQLFRNGISIYSGSNYYVTQSGNYSITLGTGSYQLIFEGTSPGPYVRDLVCFSSDGLSPSASTFAVIMYNINCYKSDIANINENNPGEIATWNVPLRSINFGDYASSQYFNSFTDHEMDSIAFERYSSATGQLRLSAASPSPHKLNRGGVLKHLGISNLPNISSLYVAGSCLRELDLSSNTNLGYVDCSYNALSTLDLSDMGSLASAYCHNNALTNITFRTSQELSYLYCPNNYLTSLDLSSLIRLVSLACHNNAITSLNISTISTWLDSLYCHHNQITSIAGLTNNTRIRTINCSHNRISALNLTGTNITTLQAQDNPLNSLTITGSTNLNYLDLSRTNLTSMVDATFTTSTVLSYLMAGNNITTYESSKIPATFRTLDLSGNQITSIDLSSKNFIYTIDMSFNPLTSFIPPVDSGTSYKYVYVNDCLLTSLSLTSIQYLADLRCQNNQLSTLPLNTSSANILIIHAYNNLLTDSGLNATNCSIIRYADYHDNYFDQSAVDSVLTLIDSNSIQSNGTIDLTGLNMAVPSSTGLSAKSSLEGKGWTVLVNEA